MSELRIVALDQPALLEFSGPDAVRYLNGQVTQDVRLVVGSGNSLPACITDAKGKLQFRVRLTSTDDGLWVEAPSGLSESLEARLTRYLIADDVEVTDLTSKWTLFHLIGKIPEPPSGVIARASRRLGVEGMDWWVSRDDFEIPSGAEILAGDELEALRIANGIPAWGKEIIAGMLPPEALLETTDISYNKGCYVGQEVISRIKSAGKVNRQLTRFALDASRAVHPGPFEKGTGEITSISPIDSNGIRLALGYVKRGSAEWWIKTTHGEVVQVRVI